ncbi:MAG: hypothetical protein Q4G71_03935 [Pseudomonadota bacterium]|nr:hypothetical protein [Pseudomonadota bacterium]
MSRAALGLLALCTALAGVLGGYLWGRVDGRAGALARHNAQAVQQMQGLLAEHTELVAQSQAASQSLRRTTAARQVADQKSTRELQSVLAQTAHERAHCVLPADGVRQLGAARARAAAAAASGLADPLPTAAREAGQ